MSTTRFPGDAPGRARTAGSSLALSMVVVIVVLLIIAAGIFLIFRDDPDDSQAAVIPSPSGTSELVQLGATPTPDGASVQETEAVDGATATEQTPTPSPTATAPNTATSTEEPTATEEEIEEPTSTPEPEEPEPTPTEPEPEPTTEPLEGDFGFLPPAQLPSGGAASRLTLSYQLGMSLEALPTSGTVYELIWPSYTFDDVVLARDQLGLGGDVIEEGVGVYRVEGDVGSLYVSPAEIVYYSAGGAAAGELPGDGEAIDNAWEWVSLSGFIPGEMDGGEVVARDEDSGRVVVKFRPVAPQPNLAPNPAATVTIGPGGTVLEVRIAWPSSMTPSEYGYTDPLAIWEAIQAGQGFLEADLSSIFATGPLSGTATIYDYWTAYTLAGSPGGGQYLVPVIRFEGTARIDQTGDEITIFVSIPVVWAQQGTVG